MHSGRHTRHDIGASSLLRHSPLASIARFCVLSTPDQTIVDGN